MREGRCCRLITFCTSRVTRSEAAEALSDRGVRPEMIRDAVEALRGGQEHSPDEVLLFPEFGVAALNLEVDEALAAEACEPVTQVIDDLVSDRTPVLDLPEGEGVDLLHAMFFAGEGGAAAGALRRIARSEWPWHIGRIRADAAWGLTRGAGVKVAVLDTGIARHRDLPVEAGVSFAPGSPVFDGWGAANAHGTIVAGIAGARDSGLGYVGVAPECELYAVKVISDRTTTLCATLAGLLWAARRGMDVVNMSFGFEAEACGESCLLPLARAARHLTERGTVVVAAVGQVDQVNHPARCADVIGVAGLGWQANRLIMHSPATCGIDIGAPGTFLESTHSNGGHASGSTGSSYAAPQVAGAAALLRAYASDSSAREIKDRLARGSCPIPGEPFGILDCLRALRGESASCVA